MRTPQQGFFGKPPQSHPAGRAGMLGTAGGLAFRFVGCLFRFGTEQGVQQFIERNLRLNHQPLLVGALLAQVRFGPLAVIHLGQMDRRRSFFTGITQHFCPYRIGKRRIEFIISRRGIHFNCIFILIAIENPWFCAAM
jgi:hypothetical protein